ncbi:hypothetical protein HWV62_34735, partial [Athelia sp. TMB]
APTVGIQSGDSCLTTFKRQERPDNIYEEHPLKLAGYVETVATPLVKVVSRSLMDISRWRRRLQLVGVRGVFGSVREVRGDSKVTAAEEPAHAIGLACGIREGKGEGEKAAYLGTRRCSRCARCSGTSSSRWLESQPASTALSRVRARVAVVDAGEGEAVPRERALPGWSMLVRALPPWSAGLTVPSEEPPHTSTTTKSLISPQTGGEEEKWRAPRGWRAREPRRRSS